MQCSAACMCVDGVDGILLNGSMYVPLFAPNWTWSMICIQKTKGQETYIRQLHRGAKGRAQQACTSSPHPSSCNSSASTRPQRNRGMPAGTYCSHPSLSCNPTKGLVKPGEGVRFVAQEIPPVVCGNLLRRILPFIQLERVLVVDALQMLRRRSEKVRRCQTL